MANENFTQFADGGVLQATDYLVGYRGGAETKILGSNILAYIESNALALVNGSTAVTQSPGDNSTKVATTAFVAAASGGVTSITGTSGQVVASASTGAVTLSLPSSITGVTTMSNLVSVGTITTGTWNAGTVTNTQSIGVTSTDGFVLLNTTAAANGAQQWSPRLRLTGYAWHSGTSTSTETDWIVENQATQGSSSAHSNLVISVQIAGGGYVAALGIAELLNSSFPPTIPNTTKTFVGSLGAAGSIAMAGVLSGVTNMSMGGSLTNTIPSIGNTSTDGYILANNTAATNSVTQQFSPRIRLTGTAWNSSGSASQTDSFIIENQPQTVAGTTTANLVISASINAGGYSAIHTIDSAGNVTCAGTIKTTAAVTYDFGAISNTSLAGLTALNLTRQAVITIGGTAYYFPCATSAQ